MTPADSHDPFPSNKISYVHRRHVDVGHHFQETPRILPRSSKTYSESINKYKVNNIYIYDSDYMFSKSRNILWSRSPCSTPGKMGRIKKTPHPSFWEVLKTGWICCGSELATRWYEMFFTFESVAAVTVLVNLAVTGLGEETPNFANVLISSLSLASSFFVGLQNLGVVTTLTGVSLGLMTWFISHICIYIIIYIYIYICTILTLHF